MAERKLLFSVTAADCEWSYTKGTGAGGQKRNKTSSAVHCHHRPSGAHGYSEASRSQHANKAEAFTKMASSSQFKTWHQTEVWRRLGVLEQIDRAVAVMMAAGQLKLEVRGPDGDWVEVPLNGPLDVDAEAMTVGPRP